MRGPFRAPLMGLSAYFFSDLSFPHEIRDQPCINFFKAVGFLTYIFDLPNVNFAALK